MSCCPHCKRPFAEPASELGDKIAAVRMTCLLQSTWISPDDRIREGEAATLMGLSVKTLRNRRGLADPKLPDWIKRNGHILYSVRGIAEWLLGEQK